MPADFPPVKSLDALPNNLPRQFTSFIGRENEIAEVKRLLAQTPLLTLTGTGGIGKTRLALRVAAEALEEFKDGAWLVELASLSDPALLPHTLASALGIREQPGRPLLTTLVDFLQPRTLLLVLDNAEHLVDACAQLADVVLKAGPGLRILATSRERLGVGGEVTWRVPSLTVADPAHPPSVEAFAAYEAIRLFVERAKAGLPTFTLTQQNAPWVAQICYRLDGISLAIELAAARVNVLTVQQIARRLDDAFRLLTGGTRTLPRHETLRAAMDWSYNLLSDVERMLLRRLSVFIGMFTLEAAEAVAQPHSGRLDILDLMTRLVNRSLVAVQEFGQEARFHLLETVRAAPTAHDWGS